MTRMRVGIVGCGNIGADLCIALQKGDIPADIAALTDIDESRALLLQRTFQLDAEICGLTRNAELADLVIECAVPEVVKEVVEAAAANGRDCLILSVGGLMEHTELFELAAEKGVQIRIPSGALCGLDGVRAAMEAGLHSVTLTTRKPPKGFAGSAYLAEKGIDVNALTEPTVVFEGSALEAVRALPQNVNVAAALSFAGVGPRETRVKVIADPGATCNAHEVVAEGAFGTLRALTENLPSPRNAKSSYLASLSTAAELRRAATGFAVHRNRK